MLIGSATPVRVVAAGLVPRHTEGTAGTIRDGCGTSACALSLPLTSTLEPRSAFCRLTGRSTNKQSLQRLGSEDGEGTLGNSPQPGHAAPLRCKYLLVGDAAATDPRSAAAIHETTYNLRFHTWCKRFLVLLKTFTLCIYYINTR